VAERNVFAVILYTVRQACRAGGSTLLYTCCLPYDRCTLARYAIKRENLHRSHYPADRSGEITLSITYANGPSAMCSDLRPSWPTRDDSTFDRSRRKIKCRGRIDLFVFVAGPRSALAAIRETRGGWIGRDHVSADQRKPQALKHSFMPSGGHAGRYMLPYI
jgi:hypothetical protein